MKVAEYVLRVGVFGTFVGHGILAFQQKESWITYLNTIGFSDETALQIMPVIGVVDILVGIITLVRPIKFVILYAVIWAFLTASIRPISGEPILEFVERAANWATPLGLYFLINKKGEE